MTSTAPLADQDANHIGISARWRGIDRTNHGGFHCPTCGIQTHKRQRFSLFRKRMIPLTVENRVLHGRCLSCNLQPSRNETQEPSNIETTTQERDSEGEGSLNDAQERDRLLTNLALLLTLLLDDEEDDEANEETEARRQSSEKALAKSRYNASRSKPLATIQELEPFPDDDMDNSESFKCSICLCEDMDASDSSENKVVASINGCTHRFCYECIEEWAEHENTCPLCKTRFTSITSSQHKNKIGLSYDPNAVVECKLVETRNQEPAEDELVSIALSDAVVEILARLLLDDAGVISDDEDSVTDQADWEEYIDNIS